MANLAEYAMGSLLKFGPVSLEPNSAGGWSVKWGLEWQHAEAADALEQLGMVMGFMQATANYRVRVVIESERQPGEKRKGRAKA